jgi:ferric-dicitrate binding protein FerR (iron transport regulator)
MKFEEEKIDRILANYRAPFEEDGAERAKAEVWRRIGLSEEEALKSETPTVWLWSRAAALVLLLVSLPFALYFAGKSTVEAGKASRIGLPDGSDVTLTPGSQLSFNRYTWWANRMVELDGEARFDVSTGERFTVRTNLGKVEVLGTQFTVRDDGESFFVHCREGSVRTGSTTLGPGEYIAYDEKKRLKGVWKEKAVTISEMAASMTFNRVPVICVAEALEERFAVQIELETGGDRLFSGQLNPDHLDTSLDQFCKALGLGFTTKREVVVILEP